MRRSNWTPSIVPRGDDHDVYLVVDDLGRLGRVLRGADYEATDFETVVTDILAGEYKSPIGVFAFNSAEGWSRDVSDDIAAELRRRCDLQLRDVPEQLADFVDRHARPVAAVAAAAAGAMKCKLCRDCGWTCEEHPGRPWCGDRACGCGALGLPCPRCNAPQDGAYPRMPEGFRTEFDKHGWRH